MVCEQYFKVDKPSSSTVKLWFIFVNLACQTQCFKKFSIHVLKTGPGITNISDN